MSDIKAEVEFQGIDPSHKLSKSSVAPKWVHKAQVFKSGDKWLYACQEGCGGKYISGASWELMNRIARDHMIKKHPNMNYRSQLITAPRALDTDD